MAAVIKTGDHHWWPQALASFWKNETGIVHQLFPDGRVIEQANTKKFGHIKNGHLIKLHANPDIPTVWDESFEKKFGDIDGGIRTVIQWLESLPFEPRKNVANRRERFVPATQNWADLNRLLELMISLVVRGPRLRHSVQDTTEYFRKRMGMNDQPASKSLINMNLRDALERFMSSARNRGKFAVLHAIAGEFIFGDGFLHTYTSTANAPMTAEILVPLTPAIAVFWTIPSAYEPLPNLSTLCLEKDEVGVINHTVLVHSRDFIFYRSQKPDIIDAFAQQKHLVYKWPGHPT